MPGRRNLPKPGGLGFSKRADNPSERKLRPSRHKPHRQKRSIFSCTSDLSQGLFSVEPKWDTQGEAGPKHSYSDVPFSLNQLSKLSPKTIFPIRSSRGL